jgi:predicted acylesterase/phospholipase RssA
LGELTKLPDLFDSPICYVARGRDERPVVIFGTRDDPSSEGEVPRTKHRMNHCQYPNLLPSIPDRKTVFAENVYYSRPPKIVTPTTEDFSVIESRESDSSPKRPLALVMKGGGVKGLAYVGAIKELEQYYNFDWYVGTSAGAIAAVLLAAGYTTGELEMTLSEKDFRDFLDAPIYKWPWNLLIHKGLFHANSLIDWINERLADKLSRKPPDEVLLCNLPNRVTIYAARRDEDTLEFDSRDEKTKNTVASHAVRCSVTIPYIFIPERLQGMRVMDGGMRNNYPVPAFLLSHPNTEFLGLYLGPRTYEGQARRDRQGSLVRDLLAIWTESQDRKALREYSAQTVIIDPRPITTLRFRLSDEEKAFLIKAGRAAALGFLAEYHSASGITKEEAKKAQDEVEKERLRLTRKQHAKRASLVSLALALLVCLTAVGFALISSTLPFKPPCDLTTEDTRINLSNLSDWTEPSTRWVIDRDSEGVPTGLLHIRQTERVGYSKSLCLRNFSLSFNIWLENDAGAAWALRVEDDRNYYLFYLSGPSGIVPNRFCAYAVRDDKFDPLKPINPSNVVTDIRRGAQFVIRVDVNNGEIKHAINPSNLDPALQGKDLPIHVFKGADNYFHYGSIGFRTIRSEEFAIGNIVVRPIREITSANNN